MSPLATLGVAAKLFAQTADYYTTTAAADAAAGSVLAGLSTIYIVMICCGVLFGLLLLGLNIWMIIDCNKRTEAELPNKQTWFILLIVGLFLQFGWLVAVIYYFTVKMKLDKAGK